MTSQRYLALFIALTLVGCASEPKTERAAQAPAAQAPSAQPPAVEKPLSAEQSVLASVTATVQDIDVPKRMITLKEPGGDVVTFEVDEAVQRLNEVKVGDQVTAQYYVSVAGELRAPT